MKVGYFLDYCKQLYPAWNDADLAELVRGYDLLVREQLIESILDRTPEATVFVSSHDLAEIESSPATWHT
jgi:hypothetical protein